MKQHNFDRMADEQVVRLLLGRVGSNVLRYALIEIVKAAATPIDTLEEFRALVEEMADIAANAAALPPQASPRRASALMTAEQRS